MKKTIFAFLGKNRFLYYYLMQTYFIRTYGCQMNELDSELLAGELEKRGLFLAKNEEEADLLLFNTCAVRDLAERKVMGKIGLISRKKKKQVIGIAGCMAISKKEKLLKEFPHVDFVLGTQNISDLNTILDAVLNKKERIVKTETRIESLNYLLAKRNNPVSAYISIIRGCNNFCSYCIVPYTRGREISRPFEDILKECKYLLDKGYKEITLLGQNVNSYKDGSITFPDLLAKLDATGIKRIRFLTSHPRDISLELMQAIRDLPSICEYVHFPLQSGSDAILKSMNRKYTYADYLEKVHLLKSTVPKIHLGTDMIVGYPNEREEDFAKTVLAMKEVRYLTTFIFAFSPRKNTPAYSLEDNVPKEVKAKRLKELLELHKTISLEEHTKMLGATSEVLIEGSENGKLRGRLRTFEKVVFPGKKALGTLQRVILKECQNETFIGEAL